MLTVVHDNDRSTDDGGRSLLDEIVRDGARQMLAAALQAEVAAYIEQFADQVDENGHRLVVRNGYHHERDVLTAAGAVSVKAPRVNDKRVDPDTGERQRFSSAIPAGVGAQVPADERGAAAAVSARALHQRLRAGARAVPRIGCRVVGGLDHPVDDPVAGRGQGLPGSGPLGQRLRLCVGRRHPPQGAARAGQTVPAGDDRGPRGRPEGARRPHRRVPRVHRVVGGPAARLPTPRHDRSRSRGR
ncbi:IS6120, transposase [Rhodococcus wratislaviensis]|uniref:IS6120, transposase n=1 Tax=Rhodococcus wratislaviensis TaxID=44752 RepID=A0A402CMY3_RHOWR|nr:IS6120, transposase [Rhodococcus wratislaviensis]